MRVKASEIHRSYLRYHNAQKRASLSSGKNPKILEKAEGNELVTDKKEGICLDKNSEFGSTRGFKLGKCVRLY